MQAGNDFVLWNNAEDWQTTGNYCCLSMVRGVHLRGATQQFSHHCLFRPQQPPKSVSPSRQICLQVQVQVQVGQDTYNNMFLPFLHHQ